MKVVLHIALVRFSKEDCPSNGNPYNEAIVIMHDLASKLSGGEYLDKHTELGQPDL